MQKLHSFSRGSKSFDRLDFRRNIGRIILKLIDKQIGTD